MCQQFHNTWLIFSCESFYMCIKICDTYKLHQCVKNFATHYLFFLVKDPICAMKLVTQTYFAKVLPIISCMIFLLWNLEYVYWNWWHLHTLPILLHMTKFSYESLYMCYENGVTYMQRCHQLYYEWCFFLDP